LREYETSFVVQPEISDEACQALCAKLDNALEKQGAVRLLLDDAGKRKLTYEIQKFQKGRYLTLSYLDKGPAVRELERLLRLEESVLRFLTVRVNDEVIDIEGRKTEAAEQERIRKQRAAERAAREAEEERAREEAMREARSQASGFVAEHEHDDSDEDELVEEEEE
jgi:small subunit ribosomal protein S6